MSERRQPGARVGVDRSFRVFGTVEERETGRPLPRLIVGALDRDLLFDDALGLAVTDAEGRFAIRFDARRFRDARELRPDLFLRIHDAHGSRVLHETRGEVRRNAALRESYRIRIPARALNPRGAG